MSVCILYQLSMFVKLARAHIHTHTHLVRIQSPYNGLTSIIPVILISISGKRRYLILRAGCLYYFSNETAHSPKGKFVLSGYE